ncbi:hypothetical protein MKX03_007429 [Papaver bracteatum]|nr:hypothetical protein MKX03_007429 [Papaver bracteatum]
MRFLSNLNPSCVSDMKSHSKLKIKVLLISWALIVSRTHSDDWPSESVNCKVDFFIIMPLKCYLFNSFVTFSRMWDSLSSWVDNRSYFILIVSTFYTNK